MGILKKRNGTSGPTCPDCGGSQLGLGYVDRVGCTVLHTCEACGGRWRDDLIDLADLELAARRG
ncbi:MAG: hypothetical protein ACR2PK_11170 [Acidimicrobiales bacterium]